MSFVLCTHRCISPRPRRPRAGPPVASRAPSAPGSAPGSSSSRPRTWRRSCRIWTTLCRAPWWSCGRWASPRSPAWRRRTCWSPRRRRSACCPPSATFPRAAPRVLVHAEVVDEFGQRVAELDESLCGKRDGLALRGSRAGPAVDGLPDPEKPPPLVLLQIHVVLPILAHQELALKRPPGLVLHRFRVAGAQLGVVLDEVS